jgi:dTDP-4-amino-4,6-dideoxy-D-galactose acyltransferase
MSSSLVGDTQNVFCRFLEWDSAFFGMRIARVNFPRLFPEMIRTVDLWCTEDHIDCVYYLIDTHSPLWVQAAENAGFHFVGIRVELDCNLAEHARPLLQGSIIRRFHPDDIPALKIIASSNHRDTRFYHDGHFPLEKCDKLYETWIENSCRGSADEVFVAEIDNRPVGYITCKLLSPESGEIGLLGVAPEYQGRGFGYQLVETAAEWFAEQGVRQERVVTYGRNIVSQRLYQRCGFRTRSVELWYHKWFSLPLTSISNRNGTL